MLFALLLVAWTFVASVESKVSKAGSRMEASHRQAMNSENKEFETEIPQPRKSAKRMKMRELVVPMWVDSTFVYDDKTSSMRSYDAAEEECQRIGGTLATLASREKHLAVSDMLPKEVWVGGRRDDQDWQFKWVTGEYMMPSFLRFRPSSDGGDCVSYVPIGSTGYFSNSQSCDTEMGFLCELPFHRPDHKAAGMHEKQYSTTIMIAEGPTLTYDEAQAMCRTPYMQGGAGGRLFGPTTRREISALTMGFKEEGLSGVWWVGARRSYRTEEPTWENGDPITLDLGQWDDRGSGNDCAVFDNRSDMFSWKPCDSREMRGYICQDDLGAI